jgi:hypothetical protein
LALRVPRRQRGQGVVEFGLSVAAVAFVALVGFGALGQAQAAYWGGPMASSLNTQPPPATHFMHDVLVAPPNCGLSGNPALIPAGATLTCSGQTVTDLDPTQPTPPGGTLSLYMDGVTLSPAVSCSLTTHSTGQTWCPTLTWTPPSSLVDGSTHTLTMVYAPNDNHLGRASTSVTVQFIRNLHWATSCVNDLAGGVAATSVEVGHPLRCGATLTDWTTGSPQPVTSTQLNWSVFSYSGSGTPNFTCATTTTSGGVLMQGGSPCAAASNSYNCQTDASGHCEIVYRHLYDSAGGGIGGNPTLQVIATGFSPSPLTSTTFGLTVTGPPDLHPTGLVVLCSNADPQPLHLTVVPRLFNDPDSVFGNAKWGDPVANTSTTNDADINGTPISTTMACNAYVYDTINNGSNNPAVTSGANPNKQEGFPPAGIVTVNWYQDGVTPAPAGTCTLLPVASASKPVPAQSSTQAPFMSSCPLTFTINGLVSPLQQPFVSVNYTGEPTANPVHKKAASPVPSVDNSNNPLPGYRFNVDFS